MNRVVALPEISLELDCDDTASILKYPYLVDYYFEMLHSNLEVSRIEPDTVYRGFVREGAKLTRCWLQLEQSTREACVKSEFCARQMMVALLRSRFFPDDIDTIGGFMRQKTQTTVPLSLEILRLVAQHWPGIFLEFAPLIQHEIMHSTGPLGWDAIKAYAEGFRLPGSRAEDPDIGLLEYLFTVSPAQPDLFQVAADLEDVVVTRRLSMVQELMPRCVTESNFYAMVRMTMRGMVPHRYLTIAADTLRDKFAAQIVADRNNNEMDEEDPEIVTRQAVARVASIILAVCCEYWSIREVNAKPLTALYCVRPTKSIPVHYLYQAALHWATCMQLRVRDELGQHEKIFTWTLGPSGGFFHEVVKVPDDLFKYNNDPSQRAFWDRLVATIEHIAVDTPDLSEGDSDDDDPFPLVVSCRDYYTEVVASASGGDRKRAKKAKSPRK